MSSIEELQFYAQYYYEMGFNISFISTEVTRYNFLAGSKKLKAPTYEWETFYTKRQPQEVFDEYPWKDALGFGLVLGYNQLSAIDIDGCIDEDVLHKILNFLNLPSNYPWVTSSGSKGGYHILFRTQLPEKNWLRSSEYLEDNGQYRISNVDMDFGKTSLNAYYPAQHFSLSSFCKIEFKWQGHVIMPPSLHSCGEQYKLFNKLPKDLPRFIDFAILDIFQKKTCGDITVGSGQKTKYFSAQELADENLDNEFALVISICSSSVNKTVLTEKEPRGNKLQQISWARCKITYKENDEGEMYTKSCRFHQIDREVRTIFMNGTNHSSEFPFSMIGQNGFEIKSVIEEFLDHVIKCKVLVGADLISDLKIIADAVHFCGLEKYLPILKNKIRYSILPNSIDLFPKNQQSKPSPTLEDLYKLVFKKNIIMEENSMFQLFVLIHVFNQLQPLLTHLDDKELSEAIDTSFKIPNWEALWADAAELLNHTTQKIKIRRLNL